MGINYRQINQLNYFCPAGNLELLIKLCDSSYQHATTKAYHLQRFCYRNYIYLQLMSNPCQDSKYCSGKFNKQALDIVKVE